MPKPGLSGKSPCAANCNVRGSSQIVAASLSFQPEPEGRSAGTQERRTLPSPPLGSGSPLRVARNDNQGLTRLFQLSTRTSSPASTMTPHAAVDSFASVRAAPAACSANRAMPLDVTMR